jgi:hypothetical protein
VHTKKNEGFAKGKNPNASKSWLWCGVQQELASKRERGRVEIGEAAGWREKGAGVLVSGAPRWQEMGGGDLRAGGGFGAEWDWDR